MSTSSPSVFTIPISGFQESNAHGCNLNNFLLAFPWFIRYAPALENLFLHFLEFFLDNSIEFVAAPFLHTVFHVGTINLGNDRKHHRRAITHVGNTGGFHDERSEEHTSELQSHSFI